MFFNKLFRKLGLKKSKKKDKQETEKDKSKHKSKKPGNTQNTFPIDITNEKKIYQPKQEFEVFSYDDIDKDFIENYVNSVEARKTTASSNIMPEDFIPKDKIKLNIGPDDFEYLKVIGRGYFGKVSQVVFKHDGQIYALKSLKKSKLKEAKHIEHTKTERRILEIVHHPFIVSLKFAFQTQAKLYLVMDYVDGGELFYHLRKKRRFDEKQAKFFLAQIVLAIEFLHSKKIIYRDLKPENIVVNSDGYLKVTDFGLAKEEIDEESGTQTFCGTPEYLAPEVIRGEKYGKSVDLWCIGILMYEMLFGYPPFYDKNKEKLYKKIIFNEPDFSKHLVLKLSTEAKDLIFKLLNKNPKTRPKIAEVRNHAFFADLDFEAIYHKKIESPYLPETNNDYKFIDPSVVIEQPGDSVYNGISLINNQDFNDFTYQENIFK